MIVDTSAVMAIVRKEPEAKDFNALLSERQGAVISAATLVELTMVAERRGDEFAWAEVEALLVQAGVEVVAFTPDQARIAQDGWRRFGKGRHPAALNLGDCFAYALAKSRGEPLLFKGDDFSKTDIKAAI